MKLKAFKIKKHKRAIIIISFCFIFLLLSGIFLYRTFAVYEEKNTFDVIKGQVPDQYYDTMISYYIEDEVGNQTFSETMPSGKDYAVKVNCDKDAIGIWNYEVWGLIITNLKESRTKCKVVFGKKKTLADVMLVNEYQSSSVEEAKNNIKNKKAPDFTKTALIVENDIESPESDKGLYQAMDDDEETFYYRGNVTNNYVKFADAYWRIIRLNGDGSVRLLYAETTPNATGANLNIGTSSFNDLTENLAYVGYMYGKNLGVSYGDTVKNEISSTIKTKIDTWYEENIIVKGLEDRVADSIFCNDRKIHTGDGFSSNKTTYYKPYNRYYNEKNPTYLYHQANDRFTVSSEIGNGALTHPIGLVTVDDLMYAGMTDGYNNTKSYMYSSQGYWTMSPSDFDGSSVIEFFLFSAGYAIGYGNVTGNQGVRVVLNLKSTTQISGGIGTANNPYVII